jgi:hypothetical protein
MLPQSQLQLGPDIEKVTIVQAGGEPLVVHSRRRSKSRKAKNKLADLFRRVAEAHLATAQAYLERHDQSNSKKKDGWLKDMGNNVYRAVKAGKRRFEDKED